MFLSFSALASLLPDQSTAPDADADGDIKMDDEAAGAKAEGAGGGSDCLCSRWMYGQEEV